MNSLLVDVMRMDMNGIHVSAHDHSALERIRGLWQHLNEHHAAVSEHFSQSFASYTFDQRKSELLALCRSGELRVFLASVGQAPPGGYCVAQLSASRKGEIMSIFVDPSCRGQGIGHALMRSALDWLDRRQARVVTVSVVHGNEQAWTFYERYGFHPRASILSRG